MDYLLAESQYKPETLLSIASFVVTIYFWLVQANRERPDLRFFQLMDFRVACRRVQGQVDIRRLCVQQIDSCGVLVANNSTRQNSIVRYECAFRHQGRLIHGDFGYLDDNKPPWNIPPESSIAIGLACFFDVPLDFEVPDRLELQVVFITVSGKRCAHRFSLKAPNLNVESETQRNAA